MDQLHTMTHTTAELCKIERALEFTALVEDAVGDPDERLIETCGLRQRFIDELASVRA